MMYLRRRIKFSLDEYQPAFERFGGIPGLKSTIWHEFGHYCLGYALAEKPSEIPSALVVHRSLRKKQRQLGWVENNIHTPEKRAIILAGGALGELLLENKSFNFKTSESFFASVDGAYVDARYFRGTLKKSQWQTALKLIKEVFEVIQKSRVLFQKIEDAALNKSNIQNFYWNVCQIEEEGGNLRWELILATDEILEVVAAELNEFKTQILEVVKKFVEKNGPFAYKGRKLSQTEAAQLKIFETRLSALTEKTELSEAEKKEIEELKNWIAHLKKIQFGE